MAWFGALLPAADARTWAETADALARLQRGRDPLDPRTLDQLRVDTITELLSGVLADPGLPKAHRSPVTIGAVVDLPTLLGLADNPGFLYGYGPIDAATARELAADGHEPVVLARSRGIDLLTGRSRRLRGPDIPVELEPHRLPYRVFTIRPIAGSNGA